MADYQVQGQDWYLAGSGVNLSQTTITILNFYLPDNLTPVTMAMFGAIGYMTLEPETSREENISFTGITNNGNGTWTLTGVTRGLDFVFPGSPILAFRYSHAGGTKIRATNSFQYYETLLANKTRAQTITGPWVFNALADNANPKIDSNTYTFTALDYITLGAADGIYLRLDGTNSPMTGPVDFGGFNITNMADGVNPQDAVTLSQLQAAVISGALPATTTQQGIVLIATQADWDNTVDTETIGPNTYYNIPPISMIQTGILTIIQNYIGGSTSVNSFDDFAGGSDVFFNGGANNNQMSAGIIGDLGWSLVTDPNVTPQVATAEHISATAPSFGVYSFVTNNSTNNRLAVILGSSNEIEDSGNPDFDLNFQNAAGTYIASFGAMNRGNWTIAGRFRVNNTANIRAKFGVVVPSESAVQSPTDGIYFEVNTAVDGDWRGTTRAASTSSTTVTTVAADTSFHRFEIVMNAAGTSVEFFIDGVSLGSLTTNIPTVTGIPFFYMETLTNSARRIEPDYWNLNITGLNR